MNKGNGVLPLSLGWVAPKLVITGGPYSDYKMARNTFGVCVRAEDVRAHDVHVPIHDFSVPEDDDGVKRALVASLKAAIDGRSVYVGCMGGWGRTGLFLALMAKAAGVPDPVDYVREVYTPRAVETREQEKYVAQFDVKQISKVIRRYAWAKKFPILRIFGW